MYFELFFQCFMVPVHAYYEILGNQLYVIPNFKWAKQIHTQQEQ